MIFIPLWRKHEGVRLHGFNIVCCSHRCRVVVVVFFVSFFQGSISQ